MNFTDFLHLVIHILSLPAPVLKLGHVAFQIFQHSVEVLQIWVSGSWCCNVVDGDANKYEDGNNDEDDDGKDDEEDVCDDDEEDDGDDDDDDLLFVIPCILSVFLYSIRVLVSHNNLSSNLCLGRINFSFFQIFHSITTKRSSLS